MFPISVIELHFVSKYIFFSLFVESPFQNHLYCQQRWCLFPLNPIVPDLWSLNEPFSGKRTFVSHDNHPKNLPLFARKSKSWSQFMIILYTHASCDAFFFFHCFIEFRFWFSFLNKSRNHSQLSVRVCVSLWSKKKAFFCPSYLNNLNTTI